MCGHELRAADAEKQRAANEDQAQLLAARSQAIDAEAKEVSRRGEELLQQRQQLDSDQSDVRKDAELAVQRLHTASSEQQVLYFACS